MTLADRGWQPPRNACRICDTTTEQARIGRERQLGWGQWLVRCGACANAYLDPDLDPAAQARFYRDQYRRLFPAEAAHRYDADFVRALRLDRVADGRLDRLVASLPKQGSVLEVGSGFGAFLGALHRRRDDLRLVAVEPDERARSAALGGAVPHFTTLEDAAAAGPFDLIALFHVLEHLAEPVETLRRLATLLTPQGRIVVEVPDCGGAWSSWREVHPAHLSYFTAKGLVRTLARAGLVVEGTQVPVLPGTLWAVATVAPVQPASPPAEATEIEALDTRLRSAAWRRRDTVRRAVKTAAISLLGPQRVGARVRRRLGPQVDRALAAPGTTYLLGASLDVLDFDQAVRRACAAIRSATPLRQSDINVAKLIQMRDDAQLRADIASADMICADGMGIVWGARLAGAYLPERIAGIDLMQALVARCAQEGWRPYFFGARAEIVEAMVQRLQAAYPALQIAGWHHGYVAPDEEEDVAARIRASGADCLFVAMGSPRQERFLARYHATSGARFAMGVGGAFDVLAGLRRRAPRWMQRAGMEWIARLVQEPRRLGPRYVSTNLRFAMLLLAHRARR